MKVNQGSGKEFAQAPVGTHMAICVSVIDIGTQEREWQGKKKWSRQVVLGWELPDELIPEGHGDFSGKPFFVSRFYTASIGEKATLRKDLVNWRGQEFTEKELDGFAIKNVLGKPCLITLTKNEAGKTRVNGISALPKQLKDKVPAPVNEMRYFSLDKEEFDMELFNGLTDGFKKMIQNSPEFQDLTGAKRPPEVADREEHEPESAVDPDPLPF